MINKIILFLGRIILKVRIRYVVIFNIFVLIAVFIFLVFSLQNKNFAVLNPQGLISDQQYFLIIFTLLLGMLVIVPVFLSLIIMSIKYSAKNNAENRSENKDNHFIEILWWIIPLLIILVLGVVTWVSTHSLDQFRPIESDKKPVNVQVIALQWRWLFIYPDNNIASINELNIPRGVPINFQLTSDGPMSAIWIPNLGSQIYLMNGMTSKLHLLANKNGTYPGYNSNINGSGYSNMKFSVKVLEDASYQKWIKKSSSIKEELDINLYDKLSQPSDDTGVKLYRVKDDIFNYVIDKFMPSADVIKEDHLNHKINMEMN